MNPKHPYRVGFSPLAKVLKRDTRLITGTERDAIPRRTAETKQSTKHSSRKAPECLAISLLQRDLIMGKVKGAKDALCSVRVDRTKVRDSVTKTRSEQNLPRTA